MNDGSFNGMSAVRHAAVEVLERIRREFAGFKPSAAMSAVLEDAVTDVLEHQSESIFWMRHFEYALEDADHFIRVDKLCGDEEYDANGNRIFLDEKWLKLLVEEMQDNESAELGTWDNFEVAFSYLYDENPEFAKWFDSLSNSEDGDE